MYDLAKNGVKVIYALNPTTTNAYIATEDELIKNISITTTHSGTPLGTFPLNGKLITLELAGGLLYFNSYDRSSWSYTFHSIGGTPGGIFFMDNKIYYTNGSTIYYFNGESYQTLMSMAPPPSSIISMSDYNNKIYILGLDNYVYRYVNTSTAELTGSTALSSGANFLFFGITDNTAYAGYEDTFTYGVLGEAITTSISPSNIQSYAIYNKSAIYAAGHNGSQFEIMKFNGTNAFVTFKQIVDAAGTIVIKAISETKLAVGISGSISHDGLYVLDAETGKMKTLTTDSIAVINISDHLY